MNKGDVESSRWTASQTLQGTATYMGGAAGKYALSSSTGGTNDAGHFTAKATLEADFNVDDMISGTIDTFMGADGMARDWSVELKESGVGNTGVHSTVSNGAVEARTNAGRSGPSTERPLPPPANGPVLSGKMATTVFPRSRPERSTPNTVGKATWLARLVLIRKKTSKS